MIEHIEHTTIEIGGKLHYVVPEEELKELLRLAGKDELIPHEVVSLLVDCDSPTKAWREYKNMTQQEVADKMEISQAGYQQFEQPGKKLRKATLGKIARALGVTSNQLNM